MHKVRSQENASLPMAAPVWPSSVTGFSPSQAILYVFVVIEHASRRIVHLNVSAHRLPHTIEADYTLLWDQAFPVTLNFPVHLQRQSHRYQEELWRTPF
jgi:hypothetical protein